MQIRMLDQDEEVPDGPPRNVRQHRHRKTGMTRAMPWDECIADEPGNCDERAHGGSIIQDVCECGSVRWTEVTADARATSGWYTPLVAHLFVRPEGQVPGGEP